MRYGAVGRSWNAERKTVKLNPHITKKRGVKRGSREGRQEVYAGRPWLAASRRRSGTARFPGKWRLPVLERRAGGERGRSPPALMSRRTRTAAWPPAGSDAP